MYKKLVTSIVIVIFIAIYSVFIADKDDGLINDSINNNAKVKLANSLPPTRFKLMGQVKLSDGDSLQFGSKAKRVRLYGIDSPELAQTCRKNNANWKCGMAAKQALQQQINGRKLTCIGDEKDKYGRLIATCYLYFSAQAKYQNLNAWMVKNGWAVAYKYYSKRYIEQEKYAQKNNLGIWQSQFLEPFEWRQKNDRR